MSHRLPHTHTQIEFVFIVLFHKTDNAHGFHPNPIWTAISQACVLEDGLSTWTGNRISAQVLNMQRDYAASASRASQKTTVWFRLKYPLRQVFADSVFVRRGQCFPSTKGRFSIRPWARGRRSALIRWPARARRSTGRKCIDRASTALAVQRDLRCKAAISKTNLQLNLPPQANKQCIQRH